MKKCRIHVRLYRQIQRKMFYLPPADRAITGNYNVIFTKGSISYVLLDRLTKLARKIYGYRNMPHVNSGLILKNMMASIAIFNPSHRGYAIWTVALSVAAWVGINFVGVPQTKPIYRFSPKFQNISQLKYLLCTVCYFTKCSPLTPKRNKSYGHLMM